MADNVLMKRIIPHWTAGGGTASAIDLKHYHALVEHDCTIVWGTEGVADNIVTSDNDYAAHTLNLNTGSIGVAMCGMRGAKESPFDPGPSPINEKQFDAFCRLIADLCIKHSVPVTPETVLTHAEVQHTLGVRQKGKWDISRLPWRDDLHGPKAVGDHLRSLVAQHVGGRVVVVTNRPVLRHGMASAAVLELQMDLYDLGYFSGRADSDFGDLTRASVLAFQADNGLTTDGVVGNGTWSALSKAEPRALRSVTQEDIDQSSGTAKDALMTSRVGDVIGIGGLAGIVTQAQQAGDAVSAASGVLGTISAVVTENWPALLLCGVCVLAWFALRALGFTTRKRRLRDAQEGRSLSR